MGAVGLTAVRHRIAESAARSGRDPEEIELVAVSKYATDDEVMAVYEAGHRDFGERRADELVARAGRLPSDIRWHFIGSLQRNKARRVRPVATVLHSMDRRSLAETWLKGPGGPPPVFVQVNLGDESQKGGVMPDQAAPLVDDVVRLGIEVVGLMVIPPRGDTPDDARPWFRQLRALRDAIRDRHPSLSGLSMGMTDDYTVAVEEGATVLRVGRAIFQPEEKG